jgi:hypothetical protein
MKGFRFLLTGVIGFMIFAMGQSAFAGALSLRLTDSATGVSVTVVDVGGTGMVSYNGKVGNFTVNVTTGLSKPVLNAPGVGHMDLSSVDVSCLGVARQCNGAKQQGPDTLKIELSDINFPGQGAGIFTASAGGTLGAPNSTITFKTWEDSGNVIFGKGSKPTDPSLTLGTFNYDSKCFGCFSGTASSLVNKIGTYSMTLEADITNPKGIVNDSFDFEVKNASVPEPETLVLFAAGLVAMGLVVRQRFYAPRYSSCAASRRRS